MRKAVQPLAVLVLTSSLSALGASVTWTGAVDGNWDTTTANWVVTGVGTSTTYADGDTVLFDDTAPGTGTVTIWQKGVYPGSVTVNNSTKAYVLQGGSIRGSTTLTKQGTTSLTFNAANTYTGQTNINAGTLSAKADWALGDPAGKTVVASGATLLFDSTYEYRGAEPLEIAGLGAGSTGALYGNNISNGFSFAGPIKLLADADINMNSASNLYLLGDIDTNGFTPNFRGTGTIVAYGKLNGAGGLAKNGSGTLVLGTLQSPLVTPNDYAGVTTISAGILSVAVPDALGAAGSGTTVVSGATLAFQGGITYSTLEPLTIAGTGVGSLGALRNLSSNNSFAGAITLSANSNLGSDSGTLTLSGDIGESGGARTLTKVSSASVALLGNNSYTGAGAVNAGTLIAASNTALGSTTTVSANATLAFQGNLTISRLLNITGVGASGTGALRNISGNTTLSGGVVMTGASTIAVDGGAETLDLITTGLSGAFALTKSGPGKLSLSAASSYSGATTVNAGTLAIAGASGTAASSTGFTVNRGAKLVVDNTAGNLTTRIADAAALSLNSGTFEFIGNSGSASSETLAALNITGGDSTFTLTPNGATSAVVTLASLVPSTVASVNFTGTLGNGTHKVLFTAAPTQTNGILPYALVAGTDFALYDVTDGVKAYAGYVTDINTATATDNVKLSSGTPTLASTKAINSLLIDGDVTLDGTAVTLTLASGAAVFTGNTVNLTGLGLDFGLNQGLITVGSGKTATLAGAVSGNSGLAKFGAGTLILTGANTYAGTTTLSGGTLNARADSALGIPGEGTTVLSGTALEVQGGGLTVAEPVTLGGTFTNVSGNNTWSGSITLSGNATIQSSANTLTLSGNALAFGTSTPTFVCLGNVVASGVLSGSGGLVKNGAGNLTFSGQSPNSFTGTTTVNAGLLTLNKPSDIVALPTTTLVIGDGASTAEVVLGARQVLPNKTVNITVNKFGKLTGGGYVNTFQTLTFNGGTIDIGTGGRLDTDGGWSTNKITVNDAGVGVKSVLKGYVQIGQVPVALTIKKDATLELWGTFYGNSGMHMFGPGTLELVGPDAYLDEGYANFRIWAGKVVFGKSAGDAFNPNRCTIFVGAPNFTANNTIDFQQVLYPDRYSGSPELKFTAPNQCPDSGGNSTLYVLDNGKLDFNGHSDTIGGLYLYSGSNTGATVTLGAATVTLNGNLQTDVAKGGKVGATLSGAGSLSLGAASRTFTIRDGEATEDLVVSVPLTGGAGVNLTQAASNYGRLTLTADSPFVGTTTLNGGTLALKDAGRLSASAGFILNPESTLLLDNSGTNLGNRLPDSVPVNLNGGRLSLSGKNAAASTETVGEVFLASGTSTLDNTPGSGGGTSKLTADRLTLLSGGNLNCTGTLGTPSDQIRFTISPALTNGILPYAMVNGTDFATYNAYGIAAYTNYYQGIIDNAASTDNVKVTVNDLVTIPNKVINSLLIQGATVDVTGNPGVKLTLTSGGLLTSGAAISVAVPTLKLGAAESQLLVSSGTTTVSSVLQGNALSKQGSGILVLSGANEFTGAATVVAGTLRLGHASALGASGGGATVGAGATLELDKAAGMTISGEPLSLIGTLRNRDGANIWTGDITLAGNVILSVDDAADSMTLNGAVSGAFGFTKIGPGDLALGNAGCSYSGGTTVSTGKLRLDAAGVVPEISAVTLSAGTTLESLNLDQALGSLTGSGTVSMGSGALTIGGNNTSPSAFSGILSGTGASLTKVGSGTLTLSGNNDYTGATVVSGGTLAVGHANALGTTAAGTTVQSGATLSVSGTLTIPEDLTLSGVGVANVGALNNTNNNNSLTGQITLGGDVYLGASGGTLTLGGTVSESGGARALTKVGGTATGSTTVVLSGNNSYTGATIVAAGTLEIRHASALGGAATGTTILPNATLAISNNITVNEPFTISGLGTGGNSPVGALNNLSGTNVLTGSVSMGADSALGSAGGTLDLQGVLSGSFAVTKLGAGTVLLSGVSPNTYTGLTTVSDGTLTAAKNGALGTTAAGTVVASTKTLAIQGGIAYADTEAVTLAGATFNNVNGTNSFSGALAQTAASTITCAVGTGLTLNGAVNNGGFLLTCNSIGNTTLNGVLSGAGGLTKTGTGTLLLTAANSYGGTTTLSGGGASTLQLGAHGVIPDGSVVTWTAVDKLDLNDFNETIAGLAGAGAGSIQMGSGGANTLTLSLLADQSFIGIFNATSSLGDKVVKLGAFKQTLSGNSTFLGIFEVQQGTLTVTHANALGDATGHTVVYEGATLQSGAALAAPEPLTLGTAAAGQPTLDNAVGDTTWSGAITLNNANKAILNAASGTTMTLSGAIGQTAASGLSKTGAGTVTLNNNANSYTGAITVSAGTLKAQQVNALGTTTGGTTVSSGATLDLNGGGITYAAEPLTLQGSGAAGAGALNNSLGNNTFPGAIDMTLDTSIGVASGTTLTQSGSIGESGGARALSKLGAGTLTLTVANTFTGTTTLAAGTLTLKDSGTSTSTAYTVEAGTALNLDNTGTANLGSRIDNFATLTLKGGTFEFMAAAAGSSETVGSILLSASRSIVKNTPGAGTAVLTATDLTPSNGATVDFQGTFGSTTNKILFSTPPTLTPAALPDGILPYATANNGADFATYDTTDANSPAGANGVEIFASYYTGAAGSVIDNAPDGANVKITASDTMTKSRAGTGGAAGNNRINSLLITTGGSVVVSGAFTLELASGTLISTSTTPSLSASTILAFGTATGYIAPTTSTLTINGQITGSGGLTKAGAGTLTLSGNTNSYTGATLVGLGTLQLGADHCIPDGSAVTVASSATLNLNNFNETVGSLAGAGTVQFGSGSAKTFTVGGDNSNTTFSGVINSTSDATDNLVKAGTGRLTLSGANTYTGLITINNGTVNAQSTAALGSVTKTTVASGGTLEVQGGLTSTEVLELSGTGYAGGGALRNLSGNNILSGALTLLADATVAVDGAAETLTLSGAIGESGSRTLTKSGIGTLVLSGGGNNTYTGTTTVSAGTLNIQKAQALGTTASGTVVSSGATLAIQGPLTITEPLTLSGTGASGSGALRNISGSNTFSGAVTLAGDASLTVNVLTDTLTVSGAIGESGGIRALTKDGPGLLLLSNSSNSYSGQTTISAGTLAASANNALGRASGGTTVGTGATLDLRATYSSLEALTINGGTLSNTSGANTYAGPVTLASAGSNSIAVSNLQSLTLTGTIGESGGSRNLSFTGPGTLYLPYASTYSGTTSLSGGTVNIKADQAFGTGVGGITATGTTLEFDVGIYYTVNQPLTLSGATFKSLIGTNRFPGPISLLANSTIQLVAGALTLDGNIDLGSSTLTINQGSNLILDLNGVVSGSGNILKTAGGILNLNAANTFTGTFATDTSGSNSGLVNVANNNAFGTAAGGTTILSVQRLHLAGGVQYTTPEPLRIIGIGGGSQGVLSGSANSRWDGPLTLLGNVQINNTSGTAAGPFTLGGTIDTAGFEFKLNNINVGAGNFVFPGNIVGSGQLVKDCQGTTTLNGNDTLSGPTWIRRGTLYVNGTHTASPIYTNINSTSSSATLTLGGTGTVGFVSMTGKGFLAPGSAADPDGTLTCQDLAMVPGATFSVDLNGTGAGQADKLLVNNNADLNSATLAITTGGGYVPAVNDSFTILHCSGALSGTFLGLPDLATFAAGGGLFQIDYTATSVVLTCIKQNTTTTLASSANPSAHGVSLTFTATVLGTSPSAPLPVGSVTFSVDGTAHSTVALDGAGQAQLVLSSLGLGIHTITATYSGNSQFYASVSPALSQNVGPTETAISASATTLTAGNPVNFTAVVTGLGPGAGTPGGSVTFKDGGTTLGTVPLAGGTATLNGVTSLATGVRLITAAYGGAATYQASNSPGIQVTVNAAAVDHYHITTSSPQVANVGWSETLTVHDINHNLVTSANNPVTLSSNTGNAVFYTSASFAVTTTSINLYNGTATIYVKDPTAETVKLKATVLGVDTETNNIVVNSTGTGALDHYHIAAVSPQTAGQGFTATLTAHDSAENTITNDSSTEVYLAVSGSGMYYTDNTYTIQATSVRLTAGTATLYLKATVAERVTLTAQDGNNKTTASGTDVTINPGAIQYYYITAHSPQGTGTGWVEVLSAKDPFGNTVSTDSSTLVTLTHSGSVQYFTSASYATPLSPAQVTLTSGLAELYLKDSVAETVTLTATDGNGKTGTSAGIVVSNSGNLPPAITAGPTASPNPTPLSQPVNFSVSASDPDGDPLTYTWNFGDGSSGSGTSPTHSYSLAGTFVVSVTVEDGLGGSTLRVISVTANANTPPTISNVADQNAATGTPTGAIPFTVGDAETSVGALTLAKGSSNQTVVPLSNIVFGGSGANRTVTITPAAGQLGSSTITLTVQDGGSLTSSDTFVLTAYSPPTISNIADQSTAQGTATAAIPFTIGDADSALGSLTLSKGSSNPALVPVSNIVFGGSGASRTVTVTPLAGQMGSSTITVTVEDDTGLTASDTFVLGVYAPPTISNIADQSIVRDNATAAIPFTIGDPDSPLGALTLSKGSSNPGLVPLSNIVFAGSGANRTVTLTPAAGQSGSAIITITVQDDASLTASDTFVLTVHAPPEIASGPTATPSSTYIGNNIVFQCSATDPEGLALSYAWDFGDGVTGAGSAVTHSYSAAGTYLVRVTVSDANASVQGTVSVTIADGTQAGVPIFTGQPKATPNPVEVGNSVLFSVATSDPNGSTVGKSWDFGDGQTASGGVVLHAFAAPGNYAVVVTAQDPDGHTASAGVLVTVTAAGAGGAVTSEDGLGNCRARISMKFSQANSDTLKVSGTLEIPEGFDPAGAEVSMDLGGVLKTFTLDAKGMDYTDPNARFRLTLKLLNGLAAGGPSKFSIAIKQGSFEDELGEHGLVNADFSNAAMRVPFSIETPGLVYLARLLGPYKAKKNKSGRYSGL